MILYYKNLKFKHLIKDMTIDLWFSEKFANIKDIKKKMLFNDEFVKIHLQ